MQPVRIYEIPACQMAASGVGMFGDGTLERFGDWFSSLPVGIFPRDFLICAETGFRWLYLPNPGIEVPEEFEIIDFPGGLYAVATDVDQQTDKAALDREVVQFIAEHGFEADPSRPEMGTIITPPSARAVMGFEQMDYWLPIRVRS